MAEQPSLVETDARKFSGTGSLPEFLKGCRPKQSGRFLAGDEHSRLLDAMIEQELRDLIAGDESLTVEFKSDRQSRLSDNDRQLDRPVLRFLLRCVRLP